MAGETIITVVGNLTADPELRYTQNGLPVANFTIASTPRNFDRATSEWKDGEALFLRASVWREFAEHVAGSLTKGSRVIATGRLKQRSYETKEGEKRTSIELEIDERTVAPSLDKFLNVIRNDGGTIDKIDIWGRRRLAYEINKKTEGIYAVVDFTAESATTNELDRQLNLSEAVMRTKVLRAEEAIAQVAAHAKAQEEKAAKKAAASARAGSKAAAAASAPASATKDA
jgi:small subunit ribosomal protein S6